MDKLIVKALSLKAALKNDEKGVTALEYGIIASLLGLVLVGLFTKLGSVLTVIFTNVDTSI